MSAKKNIPLTLSLVIPVYNEENHIVKCLESVAKQTIMPDEVIIVDNNSTDRTVELASKFDFVKIIKEPKQGIVFARSTGYDNAKSEYIGRIDADTRLPRDWISKAKTFLAKNPDGILTGGSKFYDFVEPFKSILGFFQAQLAFRMNKVALGHYIAWGSNLVFPKKFWIEAKPHTSKRTDIHEDIDLSYWFTYFGHKVTFKPGRKVGVDSRLFSPKRSTTRSHLKYLALWPRTIKMYSPMRAWIGWLGAAFMFVSYLIFLLPHMLFLKIFKR